MSEQKKKEKKVYTHMDLQEKIYSLKTEKNFAKLDAMSSPYLSYRCKCGHDGVVVGRGFDYYQCSACGKKYILNLFMETTEVTKEMMEYLEKTGRAKFVIGK